MRFVFGLMIVIATAASAYAVNPNEVLADPVLEARARDISKELRCLVCQNQSIDDSDAELARDLRVIVRERLVAGDSDEAVIDFVVSKYGEFVLLRPRIGTHTLLLWTGPFLLLLIGALWLFFKIRQSPAVAAAGPASALDDAEEERLKQILDERS